MAAAAIEMRGRAQKRKGKHAIGSTGYIGHVIGMSGTKLILRCGWVG